MRFPNLAWAIAERHLAHYQVAASAAMSESRFSRCLSGRIEFTPEERLAVANTLGYPSNWLFREIVPPSPRRSRLLVDAEASV